MVVWCASKRKESARRIASTTSENRKPHWKEKDRTERGRFFRIQSHHCHPDQRKREWLSTNSPHATVYLFQDLNRDMSRLLWMTVGPKGRYSAKRRTCKRHSRKTLKLWKNHPRRRPLACVCVCVSQWKKVPDERQARQATPAILQVSSSKHNAKKITRVRGPFHQSITAILTEEKREEKQFTKPTHVAVYLFRDLDRDRSRL